MNAWRGSLIGLGLAASFAAGAQAAEPSGFFGDLMEREKLTGDWGGARSALEDKGVSVEATFTGDFSTNTSGGLRRDEGFSGLLQLGLTLDLEKLVGWQGGEIYAGAYFIRGHGLTTHEVGNLLTMSNIEFDHSNRLAEVYFKQTLLDDKLTFKIGQLAADGDFATSDTAGLFVNSTFGWPGLMGVDLYSGGPAYPVPTPGVHAAYTFNDQWSVQAGLYNGDPAGRDDKNDHNLDFPVNDGAFAIGELIYTHAPEGGLPGVYKVGAWYNSLHFEDLRRAQNGLSLADPGADDPRRHDGAYAIYGVIDQTVWQETTATDLKDPKPEAAGRALSVFARGVVSPESDRSLIDYYFDVGFNFKGPFRSRPDDVFGVAFAYAHISKQAQRLDRDSIRINGSGTVRSSEMVIEASYQAAVAGWLKVQPFAQYVVRPGGGDPDPDRPNRRIKNATILGVRTIVDF
ncbi:carbohydrate porin [Hansschlegelia sp. KR7-227]|uniref:carbohydrate porin n=1 Tax=Hansschlegelia sp. KR7-227 TaxID=3400914 RepID=UPI003BFC6362